MGNKFDAIATKQFDLEQQILDCWRVTTDLKDVQEMFLEGYRDSTPDNISNIAASLSELYDMRFDKLWRTFEETNKEVWSLKKEMESLKNEIHSKTIDS
jgi:hypothetical protein